MAAANDDDVEFGREQHGVANFTRTFHVELRGRSGSTWNIYIAAPQQSMISLERYAALFRDADLRRTFGASALGRLPIGLTGLAILLLVQTNSASFALGGAATACYVVGLAAVAPALGRLIDRHGPRRILFPAALIFPSALCALAASVMLGATAWTTLLCAVAAGASFPPITVCMRTYFRQRVAGDAALAAAYSAESVLIELIFILGPMIVALFVALASAVSAVLFSAACGLAGTLLFLRSPALRAWRVEPRRGASLLGPLAEHGFPSLIGTVLCFSTAFGLLEVGIAAYGTEIGAPATAGVFLGVASVGSAFGGLAYGSRSWHLPLARQFSIALGLMAAGLGVLALPWTPLAFAAWCAVAGVAMAPALIIQSMLVARTARAEHATEAFTWATSALLTGVGIGVAAGGALLEVFPSPITFAVAGGTALIAAVAARLAL